MIKILQTGCVAVLLLGSTALYAQTSNSVSNPAPASAPRSSEANSAVNKASEANSAKPSEATTQNAHVTFLLMNDIYQMSDAKGADNKLRGGFARVAAVVKAERAKGGHVLLAHGGDTLSPSLMSAIDKGAHIIALTNMIKPDVFAPGNHEFDEGTENFNTRMKEATFPIYAANLRNSDGSALPFVKNDSILDIDGVKIGLTGAAFDKTTEVTSATGVTFAPTVDTMVGEGKKLRGEGADFVVDVLHAQRGDSLLLQSKRAADLILTGHTHDMYIGYDEVSAIVESSNDGKYVTAVDVDITVTTKDGKRKTIWWPQFRVIDTADVTPDPDVAAKVADYQKQLDAQMNVAIGTTVNELDSRSSTVRTGEAAIGNLIADAMRATMKSDIAIMNGGGIRAGKVYAAGSSLTRKDILAELPFGNRLALVSITGANLKAAIEHGIEKLPESNGRFPQISGFTVSYDVTKPAGERVTEIKVGDAPLDAQKKYSLAINDFNAKGGDGYTMFEQAQRVSLDDDDAPMLADSVMVYVEKLGTVTIAADGRMKAASTDIKPAN